MTVWKTLRARIIHLFTPHCTECESYVCETCEVLKAQVVIQQNQIRTLTEAIAGTLKPSQVESPSGNESDVQPILPRVMMPSRVRAELEANDRAIAQAKARADKEVLENPVEEITLKDLEEEIAEVKAARDAKIN